MASNALDHLEQRIHRDWPDLHASYERQRGEGHGRVEAMSVAVDQVREQANEDALFVAGVAEGEHAKQHLAETDDPATPHVDERHEATGG